MRPLTRVLESGPDRQFLLWILAGLIAATIASGATAMAVALANTGVF